jgi:hypothetical protein
MALHDAGIALGVWVALLAAMLAGCGGKGADEHDGPDEAEVIGAVTLPPAPPLCERSPAQLILFAGFTSATCTDDHGLLPECRPSCGAGNPPCPGGSTCTGTPGNEHCEPADCALDPAVCTGGTVCNTDTHRCALLTCSDDTACPCGSYCEVATKRCRLDCLTGVNTGNLGLACNGTLTCNTRGRCSSTAPGGGTLIPAMEVALRADPSSIEVTPNVSGVLPPVDLTIRLTTKDLTAGTSPPRQVRVAPAKGMQVACSTTASLSSSACMIAGWTYALQNGTYTASRVIRVAVDPASPTDQWMLELATDDEARHISVEVYRRPRQPQSGRYRGVLTLGSSDPATTLPIEATVTDTKIAIYDPSRIIAPTGTAVMPINNPGEQVTSFLGGKKHGRLYQVDPIYFGFHPASLTFDAVNGKLTGELHARLGTSPNRSETWTFRLTRTAALTGTAPCPANEVMDPSLGACVPGEPWDPAPASAPSVAHPSATRWLNAMAPRLGDSRLRAAGVEPLAEHLLCFDASNVPLDGQGSPTASSFLKTTSPVSGDLACSGATPHSWWGIGLIGYQDRGPVAPRSPRWTCSLSACSNWPRPRQTWSRRTAAFPRSPPTRA